MRKSIVLFGCLAVGLTQDAEAQWSSGRPDGHAPIGVMMDHTHEAGEYMFSYRFMYMQMQGLRDGNTRIEPAHVLDPNGDYGFMVVPTEMPMQMHMFGLMFAPADVLTLAAMLPVVSKSMDHVTRMGSTFTTESAGVGDVKLGGLVGLGSWDDQRLHGQLTLSFPTGSIDEMDETPMGEVRLPYPMQIGSGTWDLTPGATYLGQAGDFSWGAQGWVTLRLGENDNGYSQGNLGSLTAWGHSGSTVG